MPQSLSQVIVHVVFSTKNRKRWLDDGIRPSLHAYLATVLRDNESQAFRIGGVDDHIHAACTLPRSMNQMDLVSLMKVSSSKWLKKQRGDFSQFHWQRGYGAFSISNSHLDKLLQYIDCQETHHKRMSFQEEFIELLKRYNLQYDERYVWD
jgi:REP element-mobilizing transposase RayT